MFVINCKNYEEIAGEKIRKFIKTAEKVAKKHRVKIAVAPPQHLLGVISKSSIPILAQHVDVSKIGSTTGFVVPELLKKSGVSGSLINHSEHRIPPKRHFAFSFKNERIENAFNSMCKGCIRGKKICKTKSRLHSN